MDNGLKLAKKYRYTLRIVTLEGESLNPGGSISGGTFKNTSNLLGRHREMDEMAQRMKQLKEELEQLNLKTDQAHDEKRENKRKISLIQQDLQEMGLRANTLSVHIKQLKTSESSQETIYQELSAESAELKRQTQEVHELKKVLLEEKESDEKLRMETEAQIGRLNERLEEEILKQQEFSDKASDLNIRFTGYLQKQDFLKENLTRIMEEIEELQKEMLQLESQLEENGRMISDKKNEAEHMRARLLDPSEYGDGDLKKMLEELSSNRQKMLADQKKYLELRESLSDRAGLLDKELFRLGHLAEKCEEDRNKLSNYMWEEYELTFNKALEERIFTEEVISQEELRRRIAELKKSIKDLGNINVNAIEEYKEVSERYALLKTQHDDLVEAEAKLAGIIIDLDQAMRVQFGENFVKIQKNFQRIFSELFGGGKGTLELMEDEDILEAGIGIVAQPPGKKLQNMMQLSGGEKALTAIALLFAIQSLKPSPFCLLDEIEAALDDANVKRYARYLNHLTEDTQFIIITHRRGTMNAADALYGVTMQEKGVSALVSVNLIENDLIK